MKNIKLNINPPRSQWELILKRPTASVQEIESVVKQIFEDVRLKKNEAVQDYTNEFDKVQVTNMEVSEHEIDAAEGQLSEDLKKSITLAKHNIQKFHDAQRAPMKRIETSPGVVCWQEKRPITKIGLYIPGGTATLFSSVLMLGLPSKIAGCRDVIICTPPDRSGNVAAEILYCAKLCGITRIFKVGGIQAIAAMTFGTETIPRVFKIFGPGNQFVTVAKQLATSYGVAIDMPAGPSELLVYADTSANAAYVAADLLSQAEHGTDSQVVLVSTSKSLIEDVQHEIELQLVDLPRKDIAQKAIENSRLITIQNEVLALELINLYGPEHLIICSENADDLIKGIQNAGSVFIGNFSPESAGDYASGTNHTLPTNGYAKAYSGVNLDSFLKGITFQKISKAGLLKIGTAIEIMAEAEGLLGHSKAVSIRLKDIK